MWFRLPGEHHGGADPDHGDAPHPKVRGSRRVRPPSRIAIVAGRDDRLRLDLDAPRGVEQRGDHHTGADRADRPEDLAVDAADGVDVGGIDEVEAGRARRRRTMPRAR